MDTVRNKQQAFEHAISLNESNKTPIDWKPQGKQINKELHEMIRKHLIEGRLTEKISSKPTGLRKITKRFSMVCGSIRPSKHQQGISKSRSSSS